MGTSLKLFFYAICEKWVKKIKKIKKIKIKKQKLLTDCKIVVFWFWTLRITDLFDILAERQKVEKKSWKKSWKKSLTWKIYSNLILSCVILFHISLVFYHHYNFPVFIAIHPLCSSSTLIYPLSWELCHFFASFFYNLLHFTAQTSKIIFISLIVVIYP